MNQLMAPGLYAVLPEIIETVISPSFEQEPKKASARVQKLQEQYGYAEWKKVRNLSPITIQAVANNQT